MINPLLFCTGSQTRREVPLLLSTRNFVDQPKFRQADIFLSPVELDLTVSVGAKAI